MSEVTTPLAVVMLAGAIASFFMIRLSTRLTVALVGLVASLAGYTILNVVNLELWLNGLVSAISTLDKDLLLVASIGWLNVLLSGLGVRGWRLLRWAMPVSLAVWKAVSWLTAREVCSGQSQLYGYLFDFCAFQVLSYRLSEMAVLIGLAGMIVVCMVVLWPMASWRTRVGRTVVLLLVVAGLVGLWLLTMMAGAWQIGTTGQLSDMQYIIRPLASIGAGVMLLVAVLYLPVTAVLDKMWCQRRMRPVLDRLKDKVEAPELEASNPTTRTMDHLGAALQEEAVEVGNSSSVSDAKDTARWLDSRGGPPEGVPRDEYIWLQRSWLFQVAKVLKHDARKDRD